MGLDQYLRKKTYVQNWSHQSPEQRHEITVTKGGKQTAIKPERISYITEIICTWRKFNALHRWMVENVQDGNDDCKEYYASNEKLQGLLDLLKTVNKDNAHELFPTANGFFFGGTDYDEYYFEKVKQTIQLLEEVLQEEGNGGFYYNSSW